MREIKYRVWVEHLKEFKLWGFIDSTFVGPPTGSQLSIEKCKKLSQQHTGIKDKNGVEIYEGDIVKEGYDYISHVVFGKIGHDSSFNGLTGFALNSWNYDDDFYELHYDFDSKELEIIGNIHENSELLK